MIQHSSVGNTPTPNAAGGSLGTARAASRDRASVPRGSLALRNAAQQAAPAMLVLVVDDVRINRCILTRMLQQLGAEVREAENGAEALRLLEGTQHAEYSAVLLDLCMPVLDGWATIAAVRRKEAELRLPRLPIVCCTSECLEDIPDQVTAPHVNLYRQSLIRGFDECVTKPLSRELLRELLCKHARDTLPTLQPAQYAVAC